MSKITDYFKNFCSRVESTDCSATQEETINGRAFTYNKFKFTNGKILTTKGMTITGEVRDCTGKTIERHSEVINEKCTIDTIAIFKCKEAFGMKEVIGVAFGESK
jgi:hypothetical protein